jgi:N6-adenosine-specific RNA methylase IME4
VNVTSEGGGRPDEMVRHLRLRGGALDGMTWSGVIDIGKRVCCGTGFWSKESVYVVTSDTTSGLDGQVENVAVPAAF